MELTTDSTVDCMTEDLLLEKFQNSRVQVQVQKQNIDRSIVDTIAIIHPAFLHTPIVIHISATPL